MPPRDRPNFLIVMPDQQRGDALSIDGHPALVTPHMDHLGHRGTRFTRAYSTCPSCIPARRSLMSGLYPASNGMVGYEEGVPWSPATTLPAELSRSGYQTAIVGRCMHLYPLDEKFGFEIRDEQDGREGRDDGYRADLRAHSPYGERDYHLFGMIRSHGLTGNGWTARPWHLDESLHPTNWTVSRASRFLHERDRNRPFFLVASFVAPHPPLNPPAFYFDRYHRMEVPPPAIGDWAVPPPNGGLGLSVDSDHVHLTGERLRSAQAGYYGLINHLDDQLSRLMMELAATGAAHNTVVIFTSDHGEMLGDHYLFRKCYPFEGSARIPMMINGPASLGFKSGQVCDRPVCLEDLMPTVLDLAGCEAPAGLDGRSLAPWLRGERDAAWREYIHGEHATCYRQEQANHYLTDGREKYVWMTHRGTELMFDLQKDPQELHNLAGDTAFDSHLAMWRSRLMEILKGRPEGFTDGERLIAGRPYRPSLAHVHGPGAAKR